jgi:hypothetical protein
VVLTPLEKFDFADQRKCKAVRIKVEELPPQQLRSALLVAMGYVGRPYDWLTIFRLAWYWMLHLRHGEAIPNDRHALICSEVIAMPLWKEARFRFRDDIPPENTAPKDIAVSDRVEPVP